jgi:cell fate regulator YaaT (PSP1 superfamily)
VPKVVSIRLRHPGQFYDFDLGDLGIAVGDWVIVETVRGQDIGQVVMAPREVALEEIPGELKPVVRLANEADFRRMERFQEKEAEVLARVRAKVAEAELPMRLVAAEYTYNGRSLTIYFSAEQRVDFRDLVKELAREFRARIELRQIGARDEARLLGGIGTCGRELCCATWLQEFLRISVRMAKDQDLPLSPMKISGVCGRLLCCLSYECEQYREIKSCLPAMGDEVTTLRGCGRVIAVRVLRESVTVEVREGVTVDVTADELAEAGRLEAEGRLSGTLPEAAAPANVDRLARVEGVWEQPLAAEVSSADVDRAQRHKRRRRKKGEGGEAAAPRPAPAAERPRGPASREEGRRRPPRGQHPGGGPPEAEGRPPAPERRPPEAPRQEQAQSSSRRRRPRRRRPSGERPSGGQ